VLWKLTADFVALVHALCVVVMILGPLLGWRRPRWRAIHLALLFVAVVMWSFYCPLTVVENLLRTHYDPSVGYQRGFLEYLNPLLDLETYGAPLAWAIRGWFALWAVIYGVLWAKEARGNRARSKTY
jgi:hypothetical protein